MAATTSHSMKPLVEQLRNDYSALTFQEGDDFYWDAGAQTVYFMNKSAEAIPYLLHETAHALLNHSTYVADIGLIGVERDAWEYARTQLAPRYQITIPDTVEQDALDTYRDWLHARSTCPECSANGLQAAPAAYQCISCSTTWRVNEARTCRLMRYRQ